MFDGTKDETLPQTVDNLGIIEQSEYAQPSSDAAKTTQPIHRTVLSPPCLTIQKRTHGDARGNARVARTKKTGTSDSQNTIQVL